MLAGHILNMGIEGSEGIIVTTSWRAGKKTERFAKDLSDMLYGTFACRKTKELIGMIPKEEGMDVIVVADRNKEPYDLSIGRVGEGPTYVFRIFSYKKGGVQEGYPEVILEGFKSELGKRVEGYIRTLFPRKADYEYRNVVTFCNSNDFIFVRKYRYMIGENGVVLEELGPRFTMKLRRIRRGMFGKENEWERKKWGKGDVYL